MIRANLLPRTRERVRAFGTSVDARDLRTFAAGCAFVALAALSTAGVELLRLHHLASEATSMEATLEEHSPQRAFAQRIAFDLARLETTERRAAEFRLSGPAAADEIARLGNAIPRSVYLDDLTIDRQSIRLRGRSPSLDRIGDAMTSLDRAFPGRRAILGDLNDRSEEAGLAFTAELGEDSARPAAAVPVHEPPRGLAR